MSRSGDLSDESLRTFEQILNRSRPATEAEKWISATIAALASAEPWTEFANFMRATDCRYLSQAVGGMAVVRSLGEPGRSLEIQLVGDAYVVRAYDGRRREATAEAKHTVPAPRAQGTKPALSADACTKVLAEMTAVPTKAANGAGGHPPRTREGMAINASPAPAKPPTYSDVVSAANDAGPPRTATNDAGPPRIVTNANTSPTSHKVVLEVINQGCTAGETTPNGRASPPKLVDDKPVAPKPTASKAAVAPKKTAPKSAAPGAPKTAASTTANGAGAGANGDAKKAAKLQETIGGARSATSDVGKATKPQGASGQNWTPQILKRGEKWADVADDPSPAHSPPPGAVQPAKSPAALDVGDLLD
ncbi:MAG: hypothetical protein KGL39_01600 [Patescibacteria group bacterium]|nr:hypothetical protein [Patescibacteria group bacterium]